VTFTATGRNLSGNIDVDTISSLDLYLLSGTTYTGAIDLRKIPSTPRPPRRPSPSMSGRHLHLGGHRDSTVTNLNAADGAHPSWTQTARPSPSRQAARPSSRAIQPVHRHRHRHAIPTTVTTGDANALSTDFIDRSGFDSYYATTTSFSQNASAAASTATDASSSDTASDNTGSSGRWLRIIAYAIIGLGAVGYCTMSQMNKKNSKNGSKKNSKKK
jgi:hypothetical protein